MAIAVTSGSVTVRLAELEFTMPNEAVIVLLPFPMPVAMAALNVATAGLLEFHVTVPEMLPVVASVKVPVAVKVVLNPLAILGDTGEITIPVKAASVTVMPTAGEVMPFDEAMMVAGPMTLPVAMTLALKLATVVSLEVHSTVPEMLLVVPSVKVPVAVKVVLAPIGIVAD